MIARQPCTSGRRIVAAGSSPIGYSHSAVRRKAALLSAVKIRIEYVRFALEFGIREGQIEIIAKRGHDL